MSTARPAAAQRKPLVAYLLLTFALSWAIELPLALSAQGVTSLRVPLAWHYLASFGPFLAALIVTLATGGWREVKALLSGLARWRMGRDAALFVVALPLASFALVVLATRLALGAWPDLRTLGQVDYLPTLGVVPAFVLWLLTFGVGEEVGWRGFALPRLQGGMTAFRASLVLGAFWAVWHLPAIFYRDTYLEMGVMVLPMLLLVATVGSLAYTWLYNATGGSLLAVSLYHGLFDFFSVWQGGVIGAGAVMTVVMVFFAVRACKRYGLENLAPVERVILRERQGRASSTGA